jgi:Ca2+-binding RTX toxin-like protein
VTISVSGNYVVGSGQSLTFTNSADAAYTLIGGVYPAADPNFTDQGSITVNSIVSYVQVVGLTDNQSGSLNHSLIEIAQTGSLSVTATGAGAYAWGYLSWGPSSAAVENDGTLSVTAGGSATSATGVALVGLNTGSGPDFVNTGQFTVTGPSAMAVTANSRAYFVNSGTIDVYGGSSEADGFVISGPSSSTVIINSGTITATASSIYAYGIRISANNYFAGQAAVIKNSGTITAQHAIAENMANSFSVDLTNSGTLNGDVVLMDGSSAPGSPGSVIINIGSINGAIHFNGSANDYYDGRGGTQSGGIFLGAGTNTAYLGNDGEAVTGGAGAAAIIGGTGADTITGGSGNALIEGGGGNDVMTGGAGADIFLFTGASGAATITNFSAAKGDKIDLSAVGTFYGLSGVLANAVQSGSNTIITIGSGTLTLQNLLPADLDASDFTFSGASVSPVAVTGYYNDITGVHVFSGASGGPAAYAMASSSAMTLDAYILVQDSGAGDFVTGVTGAPTINAGASLVVDATGSGSTSYGVITPYGVTGSYVTNAGVISVSASSQATAILLSGAIGVGANNSGSITATSAGMAYGIEYSGPFSSSYPVQITNTGTITAQVAIFGSQNEDPGQDPMLWLTNSGTINGAIELGRGPNTIDTYAGNFDHKIINTGAINGAVHLSLNGADTYDGRGGTLTGGVYLAGGANTIYLGNDGETVYAGNGGAATITGGTGNDTITGGARNDTIIDGGGNDLLTGGGGVNTFVFTVASGQTVVTDFNHAAGDQLDVKGLHLFFSLADVIAAATQVNADTVISLGGGAAITLQNVVKGNLTAADFVFAPISVSPTDNVTIGAGETLSATLPMIHFTFAQTGGVLTNNGSLSVTGTYGYSVAMADSEGAGALFTNNGQVSLQAATGQAVSGVTVQNSGTITATLSSSGQGIQDGSLTNSGTLSVNGSMGARGINDNIVQPLLVNQASGQIQVTSTSSNAMGLVCLQGGEVDNAGTINVSGSSLGTCGVDMDGGQYGGGHGTSYALVNNSGTITVTGSGSVGVQFNADWAQNTVMPGAGQYNVINSGTITAPTAIQFAGSTFMSGGRYEVGLSAGINNSGTINGDVLLSPWSDHILNTGGINGAVNLGAGNDSLDSHLGTITGVVTLGSGSSTATLGAENNTVALAAGTHVVDGGGGTNTVSYANAASGVHVSLALQGQAQSTGVGTDTLSNFQALIGSAFNDALEGSGTGPTTLTGGLGADTFVVSLPSESVTITDFSDAQGDKIDLSHLGLFIHASDVLSHTSQVGSDTVITFGGDSLTLKNVAVGSLAASDFIVSGPTVGPGIGGAPTTGNGLINGTSGNDWLQGGSGADTLHGGLGSDYLDGGGGLNTALYDGVYRQYTVVLGSPTIVYGSAQGGADDLVNIQRIQFVDGYMAYSTTDTAAQVYRLYEATLNRAPDPAGLAYWARSLDAGMTLLSAAGGFVGSAEFQGTYGSLTDSDFVSLLYNNVLHRTPDAGGLAYWMGLLSSGHSRAEVVVGFTESAEDIADLAAPVQQGLWVQDGAAAEVARLYDTAFSRLPDATGLAYWTHALESGTTLLQVAQGFIASAEFQGPYGALDNTGFVSLLYNNVLHRAPDAGGLAYWVSLLNTGQDSRAQEVVGFSESAEHVGNTAPHIDHGIWVA